MIKSPSTALLAQLVQPAIRVPLSEKRNEDTHIRIMGRRFRIVGSTQGQEQRNLNRLGR